MTSVRQIAAGGPAPVLARPREHGGTGGSREAQRLAGGAGGTNAADGGQKRVGR